MEPVLLFIAPKKIDWLNLYKTRVKLVIILTVKADILKDIKYFNICHV